jgi:hypothetical protein
MDDITRGSRFRRPRSRGGVTYGTYGRCGQGNVRVFNSSALLFCPAD